MSGYINSFISVNNTLQTTHGTVSGLYERQQYSYSAPLFPNKKSIVYLNLDNIHKMIKRFIEEKGKSKEELAKDLEITVKSLEQVFSKNVPTSLLSKINLPLARLYCGTKW